MQQLWKETRTHKPFRGYGEEGKSDLIRYGTREANKQPTAAHRRDKPEPLETLIPKGILVVFRIRLFTDSDVLTAAVQSEAAVKMNTVARIARHADAKKASVCLKTPLRLVISSGTEEPRIRYVYITKAKNAQIVPMRMR